jgi:fructose-1,6-bisphosphatase/inositol monophosphatase family enzyme
MDPPKSTEMVMAAELRVSEDGVRQVVIRRLLGAAALECGYTALRALDEALLDQKLAIPDACGLRSTRLVKPLQTYSGGTTE